MSRNLRLSSELELAALLRWQRSNRSDMREAEAAHRVVSPKADVGVAPPKRRESAPNAAIRAPSERDGLFDRACYQTPGHRSRMSPAPIYPLISLCRAAGLPDPVPEYHWHPVRKYRADYALVLERVLIEYDGGLFINGGHSRGKARLHDMEKDRAATLLGWRTLRYAPNQMAQTIADLRILLAGYD